MTTTSDFLRTGVNTGNSTTTTESGCVYMRYATLTPSARVAQIAVPDGLQVLDYDVVVASAHSGSTTPITVRCGTSANNTLYGTVDVSAEGVYRGTLNKGAAAVTGGTVVFDATCAGSSAGFVAGLFRARVQFGEV